MDSVEPHTAPAAQLPEWHPAIVENTPPDVATPHSTADARVTAAEPPQVSIAQVASVEPHTAPAAQLPEWQPAIVEHFPSDVARPHRTAEATVTAAKPPQVHVAQAASMPLPSKPMPLCNEQVQAAEQPHSTAQAWVTSPEGNYHASAAEVASMQQPSEPSPACNTHSQAAAEQPHSSADPRRTPAEPPQAGAAQIPSMQQPSKPSDSWDGSRQGTAQVEQASAAAQAAIGSGQGEAVSKQAAAWRFGGSAAARAARAAEDRESGEIKSDRSRHAEYDSVSEDATFPDWAPASPGESAAVSLQYRQYCNA